MSKVLVIPDSHLKIEVIERGLRLAQKVRADYVICLGDYFDDWDSFPFQYSRMIKYLKKTKRYNPDIIYLLGNHELSYLGYKCSGYNASVAKEVYEYLHDNYHFSLSAAIDGVLYTHAGVCTDWATNNNIIGNTALRYKLTKNAGADFVADRMDTITSFGVFAQVGPGRGGHSSPSPVWADLSELITDALPNVKQVVGHTPVTQIEKLGKCWFTDVFSNGNESDEYLLVRDGEPEILHYKEILEEKEWEVKTN